MRDDERKLGWQTWVKELSIFFHGFQDHTERKTSTGWWFQHLWKIWVRQLGWLFPIYGKMFQTTNQSMWFWVFAKKTLSPFPDQTCRASWSDQTIIGVGVDSPFFLRKNLLIMDNLNMVWKWSNWVCPLNANFNRETRENPGPIRSQIEHPSDSDRAT